AQFLKQLGRLKDAKLTICAWDVDDKAEDLPPPDKPEWDDVKINGKPLGRLQGHNGEWSKTTFDVKIEDLLFPDPQNRTIGMRPDGVDNLLEIHVDVGNAQADQLWCTTIKWVSLEFWCMSPTVFVHGNSQSSAWWVDFPVQFDFRYLLYDKSINLDPSATSISNNGQQLLAEIPPIAESFGVDAVHVVAHSKGGLDSRHFLALLNKATPPPTEVISLTTLCTPHAGSVGADLVFQMHLAKKNALEVEFSGFPELLDKIAEKMPFNQGHPDLTQAAAADFNQTNLPRLPGDTLYGAFGADLDRNGNGLVDLVPDGQGLFGEKPLFCPGNLWLKYLTAAYQAIGTSLTFKVARVGGKATLTRTPNLGPFLKNDILVTVDSALGKNTGGYDTRLGLAVPMVGANSRNHETIEDTDVAETVTGWLTSCELGNGDLKQE
ncbi:MAG: hypothetical protein KDC38_05160, partial [Planctomycetes bacterium]|nr:hypothetical protein [Planctomycetota bacterium]